MANHYECLVQSNQFGTSCVDRLTTVDVDQVTGQWEIQHSGIE